MTIYTELTVDQFLTAADLADLTEFPSVAARSIAQLGLYVTRAHVLLGNWLPLTDKDTVDRFQAEMHLAVFMIAESLALANPSRAAAAAGYTSETIGKYSYSRASGGHSSGKAVAADSIPDEALYILERWAVNDPNAISSSTTSVFPEAPTLAIDGTTRVVQVADDLALAPDTQIIGWPDMGAHPRG